jgi:hypothetical protein
MNTLENSIVQYILNTYKPRALVLHGSRANGNATETSDWDFILLVDEIKEPRRGFFEGQNIEFVQKKLPISADSAFEIFGNKFRKGNTRIVYDPENLLSPLINICEVEYDKGLQFSPEVLIARRSFVEGYLSKINRYRNIDFINAGFAGEFLLLVTNLWFPLKKGIHSLPAYEAVPFLEKHDPRFVELLNSFANSHAEERDLIGKEILNYLFEK